MLYSNKHPPFQLLMKMAEENDEEVVIPNGNWKKAEIF